MVLTLQEKETHILKRLDMKCKHCVYETAGQVVIITGIRRIKLVQSKPGKVGLEYLGKCHSGGGLQQALKDRATDWGRRGLLSRSRVSARTLDCKGQELTSN